MQSILLRHAVRSNLNFVFPPVGHNMRKNMIKNKLELYLNDVPWHDRYMKEGGYDIYALHGTWGHAAMK